MPNRLLYRVTGDVPTSGRPEAGRLGRTSAFALMAGDAALRDAGLGQLADGDGGNDVGVAIGTGVGDASLFEDARAGAATPTGADSFPFKVSSALAAQFGLTGPNLSVSTACSASAYSVSMAADAIRNGEAEVILTGGADGYTRVGVACFNRMGGLDPQHCRPFDLQRRGTVFGEGAALLVLESESHARRRGWSGRYATIEGSGWSCDAHHATAPDPGAVQIVRAMRAALDDAGLTPGDIDCVVPHGTGTPLNDSTESRALREVFGAGTATMAAYSLKAMLGHTGGAAGGFALLTAALMVSRQVAPPNVAVTDPDPQFPIDLHSTGPLPRPFQHALINAYAFGGNNISVILGAA